MAEAAEPELIRAAKARGPAPRCVVFDAWYSGKEHLKAVRDCGWHFLTQVRCNPRVNPDRTGNRPIEPCDIAATGTVVHLEGFGLVRAFRIVARNGDTEHWITDDRAMDEATRLGYAERAWGIEEYHRGLKQHCGADRSQVRYMAMSLGPEVITLREQVAQLLADNAHLHAQLQEVLALVGQLRGTIEKQQDHIAKLVKMTFGRTSERIEARRPFNKPQTGRLHLPTGRVRVEGVEAISIGPHEPENDGTDIRIPPGTYDVSLHEAPCPENNTLDLYFYLAFLPAPGVPARRGKGRKEPSKKDE